MAQELELPAATLAAGAPYPVPAGGQLVFTFTRFTTDGWQAGDVSVVQPGNGAGQVIARNVPARGNARTAKAIGDWAKLFPEPMAVAPPAES